MHRCLALAPWILFTSACGSPATTTSDSEGTAHTTDEPSTSETDTESTAGPTSDTEATSGMEAEAMGCDGTPLRANPDDPAASGPWPVGVRSVQLNGLNVEVWYPATPGSEVGASQRTYDIRTKLPASEQGKVPDGDNAWQPCNCYDDLPLDEDHGPYPAILFVHGTAGFASQSLEFTTHWASRGFVVMAADHPGLFLGDVLGTLCGMTAPAQDIAGDLATMADALQTTPGDLGFLSSHVDTSRTGMAGHSAGGNAIAGRGEMAQVLVPMGAGGTEPGAMLQTTLVLGAQQDAVVSYDTQLSGYDNSPTPKRMVGIAGTGHLAFSSLCSLANENGQDFLELAQAYEICGAQFASFLFDCEDSYIPDPDAWSIVQYATSSVFEEVLHCRAEAADWIAQIDATYADVGDFFEGF